MFPDNEKRVYVADPNILKMFSVPLIYGNGSDLSEMKGIFLSESMAKKYFGDENPINQTLYMNGSWSHAVSGVFKDLPENTHLKFDILLSFPDNKFQSENWSWGEFYTYIMVSPGTNLKMLEGKLNGFMERHMNVKAVNLTRQIFLQPIKDIHLNSHYRKEMAPNGYESGIWLLSVLSIFVLIIAYINYINLSAAKVMERAAEVGVRKVIGASKPQLFFQFLTESVIFNLLSLGLAAMMVVCLTPLYNHIIAKPVNGWFRASGLLTEFRFWMILFALVIGGSLLVGIYPAVLTSKYNPVVVLKGKFYGSHNGIITRKIFSAVQFVLAIILIAGSLIVSNQLSFMKNQPLGYDKEHTLIVRMPSLYDDKEYPKRYQLQKELSSNPAITAVGLSTEIPGESLKTTINVKANGQGIPQSAEVFLSQVDQHFFNAYKIPLIAGRNFNQQDSADFFPIDGVSFPRQVPVIVNESFLKTVNLQTKVDALGKLIIFNLEGNEIRGEIVGVSSNYHQTSLKDPYQPILYIFPSRTQWRYFTINLSDINLQKTMASVEQSYRQLFPANPFEYFFQDDYFNEQYKSDQRLSKIFNVFTALTVFISCLGILGLLHFIIRIRYKRIGIRRVLGASVINIMLLFYKDLFNLMVIATIIAVPLIYIAGSEWLNNFAFHTTLHPLIFILPTLMLIAITLGVVASQTLKTTVTNPVNTLKSE